MTLPANLAASVERFMTKTCRMPGRVKSVHHFFGSINAGYTNAIVYQESQTYYGEAVNQLDLYDWLVSEGYEFNVKEIPKAILPQLSREERLPTGTVPGKYPIKKGPTQ